jgi:hypothetical protein
MLSAGIIWQHGLMNIDCITCAETPHHNRQG